MRWASPALAAAVMLVVAQALDASRLLFPEGIALVLGVWVMRRPAWTRSRWRIVLVPSICALAGLLVERLPGPRWVLAVLALVIALATLMALRSNLGPAVSAAVLPVWFGIGEWSYLGLVVVFCGAVALCAPSLPPEAPRTMVTLPGGAVGVFVFCSVAWIALVHALALPPAAAAPPLLVACLEFVGGAARPTTKDGLARWALLAGAGCLGAVAAYWIPWEWLAGTLAVAGITVLVRLCGRPLGPALALGLVPLILGRPGPLETALAIGAGAAVLHLLPALLWTVGDRFPGTRRPPPRGRGTSEETAA